MYADIEKHAPLVEDIRAVREEHAARFGYDLDTIFADLKWEERESGRRHVRRTPRRLRKPVQIATTDQDK